MARIAADDEANQTEEMAKGEVAAASFNSDRLGKRVEEILSANRAKAAKGGGSSTDASVLAVQGETVKEASLDQLMMMVEAEERARMMRRDARQIRAGGKISEYQGKMAAWGAYAGAAGTVLGAYEDAGSFGGMFKLVDRTVKQTG